MSLVKQKVGIHGTKRNVNFLGSISSILLIEILLTALGCCAKIETPIKLLNDDYSMPTRTNSEDTSSALSSDIQQPTVPHNSLSKKDSKQISYETIHHILRDANEPMVYRTSELRYFHKRSSSTTEHIISKRSSGLVLGESLEIALNLTDRNIRVFSHEVLNCSRPLEELNSIILRNNYLQEFPIRFLLNLTLLDLSQNNFTHFELPAENKKLRFLNLNQNRIENFTILPSNNRQWKNTIRELHLKDNAIHYIGHMNFGLLNELEVLDLSCNQLKNLKMALFPTRMQNLKYLNLAHNRFQSIYRETFYNLLSMNTLILSYNEINEIDYETFLDLPNLQYLDLSHNQLKGDSIRALQGISDLVGLSIANNRELGDSIQEFVASWSLKELDASGTGLCKTPALLAQSIRTLKLANNWLTIINCGDFDSYPLLQYLDLSYSHIEEIEEDALGRLEILKTLFLDHNHLKKIPISLPTTVEHLFLQDNQIMDVSLQSFQGLNNLKTLDLSSNKLIYLPDLPLPKLLTLNLQSSGINSLHQGIVKTSPHLRDLFLEDNPIKCADLLGITEWASPCRNDRVVAKRINIKLYYVQMHNYFERFQCKGVDVNKCANCFRDVTPRPKKINSQPSCLDLNRPIRQKTAKPTPTSRKPTSMFTQETNSKKTKDIAITTPKRDTYLDKSKTTQSSFISKEIFQDELKTTARNASHNLAAVLSEVPIGKTNTAKRKQTNKLTNKKQQKHLEHGISASLIHHTPQIQFDTTSNNNHVKTNAWSRSHPGSFLMSQEKNTINILKAQTDKATQVARSINKGISHANTDATVKSNTPKTTILEEQHQPIPITTSNIRLLTTTTTEAMTISDLPGEKGSNAMTRELQQQQKHQSKETYLIGTPLLTLKEHVIRAPDSLSAWETMTNSKEVNLPHLRATQDSNHTKVAVSKGQTLQLIVGAHDPFFFQHPQREQQQQAFNKNSITKGSTKKTANNNGLLSQDEHQDLQQTPRQVYDAFQLWVMQQKEIKHQTYDQNRITVTNSSTAATPTEHFPIQRMPKDKKAIHILQQNKQLSSKLDPTIKSQHYHSAHSLNTPLDIKIQFRTYNQLLKRINGPEDDSEVSRAVSIRANHQSRINTPLMNNEDHLKTIHEKDLKQSNEFSVKGLEKEEGTTAALIMFKESSRPIEVSSFEQENTIKSERWLDIRSIRNYPGLVAVVGVTFAMVFLLGLFQIYRYRAKPFNYSSHEKHYGYQLHEHLKSQYHHKDDLHFQNQQHRHHYRNHQLRIHDRLDNKHYLSFENSHNQCLNYGCYEDRASARAQSYKILPNNLQIMHEKTPVPPGRSPLESGPDYEFQKEKCLQKNSENVNAKISSFSCTIFNCKLFQINDRRIKDHHPSLGDKNDVLIDVLAGDLFPMELLIGPSRKLSSSSSSVSSSSSPSMSISSPGNTLYSQKPAVVQKYELQKQQRRSIDDECQELNHQKEADRGCVNSKFQIW